jgi:hypothetical protein
MAYAGGTVVMIALGAIASRFVGGARPAPVADAANVERAAMSRQVAELERKVESLQSSQARPQPIPLAAASTTARGTAVRPETPPLTDEQRRARAIENEQRVAQRLDRHIEEEAIDGAWANRAAREMSDSVRTALPGTKVEDVRCQTSMCRVAVTHADAKAEEDFVATLPHLSPFASSGIIRKVGTEEAPRSVVYIARAGFDLPVN